MKLRKPILLILTVLLSIPLIPDIFIKGIDLNKDPGISHLELIGITGNGHSVPKFILKFGPAKGVFSGEGEITGGSGKREIFGTSIETVRFLEKNGWRYISSYMQCRNGIRTEHFFFVRKR